MHRRKGLVLIGLILAIGCSESQLISQAESTPSVDFSDGGTQPSSTSLLQGSGEFADDAIKIQEPSTTAATLTTTTTQPPTTTTTWLPDVPEAFIPADVLFDTGSDRLRPEGLAKLHDVAEVLTNNPDLLPVCFVGHTDSRGTIEYNSRLSTERAYSVYRWFLQQGFAHSDLCYRGEGESNPLRPDVNPDGTFSEQNGELNRRVEIQFERPSQ